MNYILSMLLPLPQGQSQGQFQTFVGEGVRSLWPRLASGRLGFLKLVSRSARFPAV